MWAFDHLAGAMLRGDTMLEAFTLLGALAASTTTIELGTMVANVNHRTPALLAVAAATLEAIAERQIHVGLGAGAAPDSRWSAEMRAIGQPVAATVAERHARVDGDARRVRHACSTPDGTTPWPRSRSPAAGRPCCSASTVPRWRAWPGGAPTASTSAGTTHDATSCSPSPSPHGRSGRGFLLTTWTPWAPELLDPDHPTRRAMADLDRVVLVVPGHVGTAELATPLPGESERWRRGRLDPSPAWSSA